MKRASPQNSAAGLALLFLGAVLSHYAKQKSQPKISAMKLAREGGRTDELD